MIGTKVGKWRITQEIGDGGHAFVFKGESDDSSVTAIKMLRPSIADQDSLEKRFLIEAEALKELRHENIVGFEGYFFQNSYHYLVLEYMDQGSIENLIKTMGPVPAKYAVPIFYKILDGVRYAHNHGYIHRDIKPNNILLNSEGVAKLTDFGIAKVVGGQNLTKKGFVLGTTLYMAPEFIAKGVVSVKTDIYALGVTLYEMLTTRKPFEFERDDEPLINFARRVCRGEATPPSSYRPIPAELERVVMKSIAQNPRDRYKTAKEFAKDLARSFPELVKRDIVIPSGRAMTRYISVQDIDEPGDDDMIPARPKRGPAVTAAVLVGLALIAVAWFSPGLIDTGLADWQLQAALGAAAVLAALLVYRLVPKPAAAAEMVSTTGVQEEDSYDIGTDESSISDFSEDTIPFHEGFQSSEPFKMTEISELKAYLVVMTGPDKGRRFGLRPVSRIGRDLRLDIRPHDREISRHHAALTFDGKGFTVEDLGSTNGTFCNEERVQGKVRLNHGDIIRVGSSSMRFEFDSAGQKAIRNSAGHSRQRPRE